MDWARYLATERGDHGSSASEVGTSQGGVGVVQRSLSLTERTRLNLSHTWYSLVETFGLQRLRAIVSGVSTLPETVEPLFLLGERYESLRKGESETEDEEEVRQRTERFAEDMASRAWVTYRSGFSPLGPSLLTTDAGWGCTIRSGQMLLLNCLFVHFKGRRWRRSGAEDKVVGAGRLSKVKETDVLSMFFDSPSPKHSLSIHNIVREGASFGIVPGHWVGPYVLCQTFNKIFNKGGNSRAAEFLEAPIAMHLVAEAGGIPTLYRSRGYEAAGPSPWKPLLTLIPVTLGVTPSINPCYVPQILTVLSMPQSVGIIGGKPGSSVYVIGRQSDRILYLDPHTLKPCYSEGGKGQGTTDAQGEGEDIADSYFCDAIHHMLCGKLDPSLALGFYCRTKEDFNDLYGRLEALATKHPTTSLVSLAEEPQPEKDYNGLSTEIEGFQLY